MYAVTPLYLDIVSQKDHWFELDVVIGESGRLITRGGDTITFGGDRILVSQGGAGSGFNDSIVTSLRSQLHVFPGRSPGVGWCISGEIWLEMIRPAGEIPRMAVVRPYVRAHDETRMSEWIPQGVYYIDTRETTQNDDGLNVLKLHAYDAMLMTEQDFPETTHGWAASDTRVVRDIADAIGIEVDPRVWEIMTDNNQISLPVGYSMREVLGNIGAMYLGNWVINYDGALMLVPINAMPGETNYLVDGYGSAIVFGGDRILV